MQVREELLCKIVNFDELENFINEKLKFLNEEWNISDHEEWGHDSQYLIRVHGEIDDFIIDEVESQNWLSADNVLNYLCYLGELEEGNYLIDYSW